MKFPEVNFNWTCAKAESPSCILRPRSRRRSGGEFAAADLMSEYNIND